MNFLSSVSTLPFRTILLLAVIIAVSFEETLSNPKHLCQDRERTALVKFNESLSIRNSSPADPSVRPKTASWDEKDCCLWDGIECDNISGHVIGLDLSSSNLYGSINSSSTLFLLAHLERLNLAYNDFSSSTIPSQIGLLQRLTLLNLSSSQFYGQVPSEITMLPKLTTLDLARYPDDPSLNGGLELKASDFWRIFKNMSSLEVLRVILVQISSSLPDVLELPCLKYLNLYGCGISGTIPSSFGNLTNLQYVNLGINNLSGPIPKSLGGLKNLNFISLGENGLSGPIPSSLGNLTNLRYLYLGANNLSGPIPSSLAGLKNLNIITLGQNGLSGEIPSMFSTLAKLLIVGLDSNQLLGSIPNLQNLTQLQELYLGANRLTGQIPSWLSNLTQLDELYVESNQLQGSIPDSIFELENLIVLSLGPNLLTGTLRFEMFAKLRNLQALQLGGSNLTVLTESMSNASLLPKFHLLDMQLCNMGVVPSFLRYQDDLDWLSLASNHISGDIPKWLGYLSRDTLEYIDLSQNLFTGFEQSSMFSSFTQLQIVYLFDNKIRGEPPILPTSILLFYADNNSLSGVIPTSFCDLPSLQFLDLHLNNLSGRIPPCLVTLASMMALNLADNFFSGDVPGTLSNLTSLTFLDLSGNQLGGLLPSLIDCQKLESIDLSYNHISGNFPYWSGDLPDLEVLNLRSNQFSGEIGGPENVSLFSKLRILDLSHNNFEGILPSDLFRSLSSMKYILPEELSYLAVSSNQKSQNITVNVSYGYITTSYEYHSTLILANKGVYLTYQKIPNIIAALDLSSNRFVGDIPVSLASLRMLNVLNLSHNHLSGPIPMAIGNLSNLESMDLSTNNFSGKIPSQLHQLTSLEYFNVSQNQLTGPIPQGGQFDTFDNSSYAGNLDLCGNPLSKKCQDDKAEQDEGSSIFLDWKIILLGYGCGLVIGLVIGFLFATEEQVKSFYRIRPKRVRRGTRRTT